MTNIKILYQWRRTMLLLVILLSSFLARNNLYAQYVHTDGTQILDENGNDIYFSGINLGNWLLWEGYLMMGDFNFRTHSQFLNSVKDAFGGDWNKAREFEHQWRMNYVTQQGITDLKGLGFNSVRVPFHYNMFWDGNAVKDDGFQYLDRVIEFCRNEDMYVLLDMHAAPGHQNPGDHSDNPHGRGPDEMDFVFFWDDPNNVAVASDVWRHIANHYKNEPVVWGYDLINEPVTPPDEDYSLLPSLITMRNAIREVDNNHIIVAEGDHWGSDLAKIDWEDPVTQANTGVNARWDNNMVYQTHHYVFGDAGSISLLNGRKSIADRLNVPLILGEYGEDNNDIIRQMTDWSINNEVDYFPWSFKKMSHDRTLWTIHPNQPYEQLKAFINNGTNPPSTLYDDMITFCQNNISNGSPGITWHSGFYDAIKPPCELGGADDLTGDATVNSVSLDWTDNANGEQGWRITRNGVEVADLPANSSSFSDSGLNSETCYDYVVTSYGTCSTGENITVCTPCEGTQSPYLGTPADIPGTIEAENYDLGCSGVSYFDTADGNSGGAYRDDDVDISTTTDNGQSGYNIGWVAEGEWLEYTVDVASAGTYQLEYRVATPMNTGEIQLRVDGNVLSTTAIASTGDWGNWTTVNSSDVSLSAGEQVIQIYFSGQEVNLNSFAFTPVGGGNVAPIADAGSDQTLPAGTSTASLDGTSSDDPDIGPSALSYSWTQTSGPAASISNANSATASISGLSDGNSYAFQLTVSDGEANDADEVVIVVEEEVINIAPMADAGSNQTLASGSTTATLDGSGSNDPDDGPSALTYAWSQTNGPGVSISNPSAVSPSLNGLSDGNTYGFELTVSDGSDNHSSSVMITIESSNQGFALKIVAEDYCNMNGIQLEGTSDDGGGENVGWIDAGDYIEYCDVNIPSTGNYTVEYRVASQSNGGELRLEQPSGNEVGTISFNATGGWQNWTTVSHDVTLTAGTNDLRITALSSGWNINWIELTLIQSSTAPVSGVAVSPTNISLSEGDTQQLSATVSPANAANKSVNWSTSNSSVATVDANGLVTAQSIGTATITVETVDGAYTATSSINVTAAPVTGVQIPAVIEAEDYTDMSGIQVNGNGPQYIGYLEVGDFVEYEIYAPENGDYIIDFTYATEATTGAIDIKVDDVTVTTFNVDNATGGWEVFDNLETSQFALAQGSHILRFDVTGREVNIDKFGFISTAPLPVSGVAVSPASSSLTEGGTQQLSAIISPSNAENTSVNWSTSNSSVATVDGNGLVIAQSLGSATITVTTVDGGYTANSSITVIDVSSNPSSFVIEAEDFVSKSGTVQAEPTEDIGGGENLGYINDGDYTEYQVILPQSGMYKVDYRIASQNNNGSISLLLDNNLIATYEIDVVTGGWQNWVTATSRIDMNAGNYTLKLLYGGSDFNLNWINISHVGEDNTAPTTPSIASIESVCYSAYVVWNASTDNDEVVGYHVFVDGVEYGGSIAGTSATLGELSLSTNYDVYVVAEDYSGNMSSPSATQSFTTDAECNVSPDVSVVWSSSVRAKDHAWYSNGPFNIPYKLDDQDDLLLVPGTTSSNMTINVNAAETYQSMFGVGASFERTTVENMLKLSPTTRTELLTQLVHPTEGAGYNLFRIPIGTSDFTGTEWYSYADVQTSDLSNFSIERDKSGLSKTGNPVNSIQVIKEAIAINPDIKFFASPWSPPGWMTSNGVMPAGNFLSQYTDLYAKYLRLFIQAYRAEGIYIEALTLQNEPLHQTGSMPTMNLTSQQHADLAIALQREFDENGISDCKIWVFDHNPQDLVNFVTPIWENSEAYDIVDGSAVHDYGGPISEMGRHHDLWPNKNLYFTERSVWGTEGMARIVDIFRNWSRSYSSWVTMIDQNNEPNEGPFTADPTLFIKEVGNANGYYAIPELYMIGHFAKHIPIGSVRISSDEAQNQVSNVAWLTPDNRVVMIVVNNSNSDQEFTVVAGGYQFSATLPGQTIATYSWDNGLTAGGGASNVRKIDEEVVSELVDEASIISLYPNPATSSLTLTGLSDETAQLVVYGLDGRMKMSQQVNSQEAKIDVSRLDAGYYLLRFTDHNGSQQTLRFVKR